MGFKTKPSIVWPLVALLFVGMVSFILLAHERNLAPVEKDIVYGSAQGEPLLLDVIRTPAAGLRPAIVFIHGGGWSSGDKRNFRALARGFAERGYVCFSLNYRLVTASDHHFPAQLDDVQRAIRWIRAHASRYGVDPNRIGAIGGSAGGHLVALLGTEDTRDNQPPELSQYSSRVQCVVDMFGPVDLTSKFPSDPGNVPEGIRRLMDGTPREKPQLYQLASPLFHVDHDTVPFLIFQGALDPLVPVNQSRRLADALKKNGVPVTYVEFPDEGHGVEKRPNQEKFVAMTTEFFDSHLKHEGSAQHSAIGNQPGK
jgi:acetyl esterase/lipase